MPILSSISGVPLILSVAFTAIWLKPNDFPWRNCSVRSKTTFAGNTVPRGPRTCPWTISWTGGVKDTVRSAELRAVFAEPRRHCTWLQCLCFSPSGRRVCGLSPERRTKPCPLFPGKREDRPGRPGPPVGSEDLKQAGPVPERSRDSPGLVCFLKRSLKT